MAKKLKVIFLGGIGEIGKNMTVLEYNGNILVIDAGLSFPNSDDMPGIDYVIPDYQYLVKNKSKIRGIVITHGHEDHIGALPYVLRDINVPIYGSNLTLALLEHKLKEHHIADIQSTVVTDRQVEQIGCFRVEFVRVTHSIAGAFALSIDTPKGIIFHTGDFKIDHTPIDGHNIDLARIAEIGSRGVTLLLQDSTNVERDGFSMSESTVGMRLDAVFAQNSHKRLIVATFASNIHRVQQIINCAIKYGRKIAFSGRSMINIAEIASKIKELSYPEDRIVDIEKIAKVPYDKLCIISTGTQGEPMSALTRMSQDDFKKVTINELDTVIFSSSPIPGNEKMIYNVINNLCRKGADVIYQSLSEVHVSGHACKEELKMMFSLLRPKYFIPVHGEYRHLKQHAMLAINMGINPANIIIPELGQSIDVDVDGIKKSEMVHFGNILLDGSVVSENVEVVLRDRKHLSEDGFVIALVALTSAGEFSTAPIIITRGLNLTDMAIEEIKEAITTRIKSGEYHEGDISDFKQVVRKLVAKIILSRSKKKPMILPIIIES